MIQVMPVILCGGSGTRLWPLSRELYPKQFLKLVSNKTLLQDTLLRLNQATENLEIKSVYKIYNPMIICNEEHRFLVAEQLREIEVTADILLEPIAKNTAPALTLAALYAKLQVKEDVILLVLPADHIIQDIKFFAQALTAALQEAVQGKLVTFGVKPTHAATGYGYIKIKNKVSQVSPVEQFIEKPSIEKAQAYIEDGHYVWNSGMFVFNCSTYLNTLRQLNIKIIEVCEQALVAGKRDNDFIRVDKMIFADCPEDSIDYAIMERASSVGQATSLVRLQAGWSDIGSWASLWKVGQQDEQGNVIKGEVLSKDTTQSFLHCEQGVLVTLGVDNLIIVRTADAVLVANKNKDQNIKALVAKVKSIQPELVNNHKKVARPWGSYECVDEAARFKVKRITVKPKAQLSLQMHYHRAEHWVVVKGTAKVTRGTEQLMLAENESTYIPIGMQHRLENPGNISLEIIEVQSGAYLGEDDIVRLEDVYGRIKSKSTDKA